MTNYFLFHLVLRDLALWNMVHIIRNTVKLYSQSCFFFITKITLQIGLQLSDLKKINLRNKKRQLFTYNFQSTEILPPRLFHMRMSNAASQKRSTQGPLCRENEGTLPVHFYLLY